MIQKELMYVYLEFGMPLEVHVSQAAVEVSVKDSETVTEDQEDSPYEAERK